MWLTLVSFALAADPAETPVPEAALAVIPLGVPQMVWKAPVRGVVYAVTQAAGVGLAVGAGVRYDELVAAEVTDGSEEPLSAAVFAGVTVAAVAYAVQVVDGSRLAEERAQARARAQASREAVLRFDAGRALARADLP